MLIDAIEKKMNNRQSPSNQGLTITALTALPPDLFGDFKNLAILFSMHNETAEQVFASRLAGARLTKNFIARGYQEAVDEIQAAGKAGVPIMNLCRATSSARNAQPS